MTSSKPVEAFFYGLYMDPDILGPLGVVALNPRLAEAQGYRLDLRGGKAKIIPEAGASTWGLTFELSPSDLKSLYRTEATQGYAPFELFVTGPDGTQRPVSCYNLPLDPQAPADSVYLAKLLPVARKLGLPAEYLSFLDNLSNPTSP
ncbi:MAG: gamma-glutamylcyclotransferase family protein [bacterium]|nr:gamma-glutamylcyclotransferase family protein [bacterium]